MTRQTLLACLVCTLLACSPTSPNDEGAEGSGSESTGDGDGDPSTGDGDGDPATGDGDGDPSTGDGDGDPSTGDGDGDPSTGDGDGDPSTGDGDGDEDPQALSVLFVGNSYTAGNDLPGLVASIGEGALEPLDVDAIAVGGAWVEDHLENPSVQAALMQHWDAVVLQGQSVQAVIAPVEFVDAVVSFAALVEMGAMGEPSRLVLYQTWPRAEGNQVLDQLGMTQQEMYEALAQGYTDAAEASGAERARVGDAWMSALTLMPPIELYAGDGSHPSFAGSYLAACVIFSQLTDVPCAASSYAPEQLSADDRAALAEVADMLP